VEGHGKARGLLEADRASETSPCNRGKVEDSSTITNNVGIGENTIVRSITTSGPLIDGQQLFIDPNTYIGPYTRIGDYVTICNTEIENTLIMDGTNIDCGRRITDSLIGRRVRILGYEQNIPRGHRLILGDLATVTL